MRTKLRIWWPNQLASSEPATPLNKNNLLLGWFASCSSVSVDVVVAFACNEAFIFLTPILRSRRFSAA
ncbi:hypothetical protein NC651_014729 [Populus alba x Populus x berolinensis]|nr:hypothetical protein NC651_014729 [Populus alba x Populus x berolinensis]